MAWITEILALSILLIHGQIDGEKWEEEERQRKLAMRDDFLKMKE